MTSEPSVNYYDFLQINPRAEIETIQRVYRILASRYNPENKQTGDAERFQILTEAGLLPGVLLRNVGLGFVCRNIGLKVETSQSLFTSGYSAGQALSIPVAHHDGNYFADLTGKKMQIPSPDWDDKQVELIKRYNNIFTLN